MEIVLAENDWYMTKPVAEEITRQIPDSRVIEIGTEHGLRERLGQTPPPDVLVLGSSLRWTDPAPVMPEAPSAVIEQGPYKAATRVLEFLAANLELKPGVIIRWEYNDWMEDERKESGPLLSGLGVRFLPKTDKLPGNLTRILLENPTKA